VPTEPTRLVPSGGPSTLAPLPRGRAWRRLARLLELEPTSPWLLAWPVGLFILITFFVGADMAADLDAGIGAAHLTIETVALLLCLLGIVGTAVQLRRALLHAGELTRHLHGARTDLAHWREEAKALQAGMGSALDQQFQRWGLTAAQREVALLVLKGLSYKEIAELRATAEHTVRNQALAIYRKAGLASRSEMAAYFLEDLLWPPQRGLPRRFDAGVARARTTGTGGPGAA